MLLPNDVDLIANHAFLSNCVKFELKMEGVTVSATPKALSLRHETIYEIIFLKKALKDLEI